MDNAVVIAVRSVELAVCDVTAAQDFFATVWGLQAAATGMEFAICAQVGARPMRSVCARRRERV